MIAVIIIGISILIGISIGIWLIIDRIKPESNKLEKILSILSVLSFGLFLLVLKNHTTPYFKDIDPFVEPCYSPISYKNSFWLITIHISTLFSLLTLYIREYKLPPIPITTLLIMVCIGVVVNSHFLYQISSHDTSRIHLWNRGHNAGLYLSFYPIVLIVSSIGVMVNMIKNKSLLNSTIIYKNNQLNWLNSKLVKSQNLPLHSIILSAPILLLIILILTLFGQDIESLNKVYTETATWNLSEHIHPPTVDDRHGHYLCTVAAYGNPKIVKPIGIGQRNGNPIIINRQLQIANAFEYMLEELNPNIHRIIRINYDKYGINLAKRITSESLSNITYVFMKPVEWFFLTILYIRYIKPEEVIKKQYKYAT